MLLLSSAPSQLLQPRIGWQSGATLSTGAGDDEKKFGSKHPKVRHSPSNNLALLLKAEPASGAGATLSPGFGD